LSDVICSVHVTVNNHSTSVALPQPALNATVTIFMATHTARRRCTSLIGHFYVNSSLTGFVVDEVHQSLVRPIVKTLVTVATPIILIDTARVTHDERPNIVFNAPLNDIFRQSVQEVVFPLR
jgi:hypothetical protein